jgi:NAD(P)-dependent dehydrogenase (short-subunit alcohol dehydrogenase family)
MNESSIARSSRLKGQVALVTSGGTGSGRAIAQTLAAAGAAVAILARSQEQLAETVRPIERDGGQSGSLPADITDAQAVRDAIHAIEQSFGPVDAPAVGDRWRRMVAGHGSQAARAIAVHQVCIAEHGRLRQGKNHQHFKRRRNHGDAISFQLRVW